MPDSDDILLIHAARRRAFLTRSAAVVPAVAILLEQGAKPAMAQPYNTGNNTTLLTIETTGFDTPGTTGPTTDLTTGFPETTATTRPSTTTSTATPESTPSPTVTETPQVTTTGA